MSGPIWCLLGRSLLRTDPAVTAMNQALNGADFSAPFFVEGVGMLCAVGETVLYQNISGLKYYQTQSSVLLLSHSN